MTEATQELMYELMKRIQGDVAGLKEGQRDLLQEMSSLRGQCHLLQGDFNNLRNTVGHIDIRLERIENRLELRELAEAQARFEPHP
ncbi:MULTISPECIES: hypothetical protein [unclassified Rhizobium]|uniref:hypothetical protein n=1 Tax=unclassified Rhizobium TaxID=2613769 RepID=UPI001AD9A432|nr:MULTISPECIES: hypothetical protein [unclassified Rhizobium]MBO9098546.1 hypothetical protein [Rhizobium sp. L58/93]MBO9132648.1 hypothetical protein [Rhizobium sp. B209b/85]MBO9168812.1 hypothetical protein [Rhizobium sp. L245/93]MBO9184762.1 hypothetical protein [Rhizobium sp. E27B/91]QXZ84938.1 hypothetical protein J5287_05210 [Rhizobium sp. K1/93]